MKNSILEPRTPDIYGVYSSRQLSRGKTEKGSFSEVMLISYDYETLVAGEYRSDGVSKNVRQNLDARVSSSAVALDRKSVV